MIEESNKMKIIILATSIPENFVWTYCSLINKLYHAATVDTTKRFYLSSSHNKWCPSSVMIAEATGKHWTPYDKKAIANDILRSS